MNIFSKVSIKIVLLPNTVLVSCVLPQCLPTPHWVQEKSDKMPSHENGSGGVLGVKLLSVVLYRVKNVAFGSPTRSSENIIKSKLVLRNYKKNCV